MGRWLDAYLAESGDTPSPEKKTEKGSYRPLTKPTKPTEPQTGDGSVSFVSTSGQRFAKNSAPSGPPRYPLFYTDDQREAARLDARRLGYPGRTVH
jgi:hypothetical protein